jgi:hypothetical protein
MDEVTPEEEETAKLLNKRIFSMRQIEQIVM